MAMPVRVPPPPDLPRFGWTPEAIRALPEGGEYIFECIDGELFVRHAVGTVRHARLALSLYRSLSEHLHVHWLGEVFAAFGEVRIDAGTLLVPDVLVLPATVGRIVSWDDITALLLCIEVLSPSTRRLDRGRKKDKYLEFGTQEYWIVDGAQRRIERWRPNGSPPDIVEHTLVWQPAGGAAALTIDLPALFDAAS
jgi:Uma2 family endonuclease